MTDRAPGRSARFRFYEELNDFLRADQRRVSFAYPFSGTPSVKDAIEAIGVPHTEVDLILVNGKSVDFAYLLHGGERVAVYPVFERFDIAPVTRLRPKPLREVRFVLDVHLGRLARYLRLLGYDCLYRNDFDDETIIELAVSQRRIILTRDRGILKNGRVTHGYWLRNTDPRRQLVEIVETFQLRDHCQPFSRCMECNALLESTTFEAVRDQLPVGMRRAKGVFARCPGCGRVYWPGSHHARLSRMLETVLATGTEGDRAQD